MTIEYWVCMCVYELVCARMSLYVRVWVCMCVYKFVHLWVCIYMSDSQHLVRLQRGEMGGGGRHAGRRGRQQRLSETFEPAARFETILQCTIHITILSYITFIKSNLGYHYGLLSKNQQGESETRYLCCNSKKVSSCHALELTKAWSYE